jgi:hypothetical protein
MTSSFICVLPLFLSVILFVFAFLKLRRLQLALEDCQLNRPSIYLLIATYVLLTAFYMAWAVKIGVEFQD